MMVPIIAVVGCGQWGRNHVRNFAELEALHTVCDVKSAPLEAVHRQYPHVKIETQFDKVLLDKEIKGVVVATPASIHYALAKAALEAGKDVLVEKPLTLRVEEGEQLVQLAVEQGRILMVGHVLCYHPAVLKLKEMLKTGALGKICYVYSNRLNLGQFRTEENILWSFAPHDISVIITLLGEMPVSLSAHGGNYLQPDIADVTVTTLKFASGVQGHIFVNWLNPYKEQKLVVMGDRGMAVFDDVATNGKLVLREYAVNWVNRAPFPVPNSQRVVDIEAEEPLRRECQDFLECIEHRRTPRTDGQHGLQVLRILDACQRSLQEGGKIISLGNEEPAFYVHETSVIDKACSIGKGTKIWHFCHLMPGVNIGERCVLGQNTFVGTGVSIGNNVKIQNNVSIFEGVVLEDGVFCGPSCVFTNIINPRARIARRDKFLPTLVKRGATIGANATILCGLTIGRFAFIGAGAVVTRDVPDYALVLGNPARLQGWRCQCGEKLSFNEEGNATCPACGCGYQQGRPGTGVVVRPNGEKRYASATG
jgi:UDP-2-acetamido-3-amino-2,3-dideoxy-glucuronate N-acetyltransferase